MNSGLSFCKTSKRCYDLASEKISEWRAHEETGIFGQVILDVGWIKEDTQILTAAGDETIKVWDVEEKKCLATLWGHRDWIESICSHPTNDDIFVSGSNDRSFRLWDLRCKSTVSIPNEDTIFSTAVVERANLYHRSDGGRVDAMGLTSVLWLKDQFTIATAGSKHSTVKFWDARFLKQGVTYKGPLPKSTEKQKLHAFDGITSLSQDERGVLLTASSMDNRIYLYNILELGKRALSYFEGHTIRKYSKAAISPDALNIASGCDHGTTYVWQVNKPHERTILMPANEKEDAYKVDWSCCEPGKLATGGNYNIQIWNKDIEIPEQ
ncbi:uncharacterized protein [Cicer arietinum]|uniref:Denticleless protein homolog isoform X2 n=1 Tax=Cicer arietinum TaxID=3827 RepID=A0A1S3E4K4_CICAR|nr:denticleless protein homolog isoform X2 [Cicer arietinum]